MNVIWPTANATVEASKAKRTQRQQARFRDRGGIFVPSGKNPLVDILLSRTVSGESPSKAKKAKRSRVSSMSPVRFKDKDASLTRSRQAAKPQLESSNAVAGSSKMVPREVDTTSKKTTFKKLKAINDDIGAEKPSKPPPKRKGRSQKPTSTDEKVAPSRRKGRTAMIPIAEKEVRRSGQSAHSCEQHNLGHDKGPVVDDEEMLVEVPRNSGDQVKQHSQAVVSRVDDTNDVDNRTSKKIRKLTTATTSRPLRTPMKLSMEPRASKTAAARQPEDNKKPENCSESGSKKLQAVMKVKKSKKDSKCAGGNYKAADVNLDPAKPLLKNKSSLHRDDIEEPPLARTKRGKKRVLKPEIILDNDSDTDPPPPPKRKRVIIKEPFEEHHDRRPPETMNVDISKPFSLSNKLKENATRSPTSKRTAKSTSRKVHNGPPQDVLERIKAMAAHHQPIDDEPDPLDCLS